MRVTKEGIKNHAKAYTYVIDSIKKEDNQGAQLAIITSVLSDYGTIFASLLIDIRDALEQIASGKHERPNDHDELT